MKKILLLLHILTITLFSATCIGYNYEPKIVDGKDSPKVDIVAPSSLPNSGVVDLQADAVMDSAAVPYYQWCTNVGSLKKDNDAFSRIKWILPSGWGEQVYKAKIYLVAGDSLGYEAYAKKEFQGEVNLDPNAPSVQFTPLYSPSEDMFKLSFQANSYTTKVIFLSSYDNITWSQIDATTNMSGIRGKILTDSKEHTVIYFKARAYAGTKYKESEVKQLDYEPIVGSAGDKSTEIPVQAVMRSLQDSTNDNYVELSWYMVKDSYGEDNAVSYELSYADNSSFNSDTRIDVGHTRSYTIYNLSDETKYYFRVRAINHKDTGEWSNFESIQIDLEHLPAFNGNTQNPSNGSTGVNKVPVFSWNSATDSDGDTIEYRVEFGEDRNNLRYHSDWTEDTTFNLSDKYADPLKPNTTYYWRVIYREKGQGITHYGGAYPSSDIWSFKTVSTGPDLSVTSVRMLDDLKIDAWVRFEITIKNVGNELAEKEFIEPYIIKNGQKYEFKALKNSSMNRDLPSGEEDKVVLSLQFTNGVEVLNDKTYNNVLEDGNNVVLFEIERNNYTHDANFENNSKEYIVPYSKAANLPEVSIDLNSNGASDKTGTPAWNLGYSIKPRILSEDNLEVTKVTLEYRVNLDDSWHMIDTYVNTKTDNRDNFNVNTYHNDVLWRAEGDQFITDQMQLRAKAYNSDTTFSSVLSEQFVMYSDESLNISNFSISQTHIQKGDNVTFSWVSDGSAKSLYVVYVRQEGTTAWKKLFASHGETQKEVAFDYDVGTYEFQLVSSYPAYTMATQKLSVEVEPIVPAAPTITNTTFDIQANVPTITFTCDGLYDSCTVYKGHNGQFVELKTVSSPSEIITDTAIEYGYIYEYKAVAIQGALESALGASTNILASYNEEYEVIIETEGAQFLTGNSINVQFKPNKAVGYENYEIKIGKEINNLSLYTYTNNRAISLTNLDYETQYYVEIYPLDYDNNRVNTLPAKLTFTTGFDPRVIIDKPEVSVDEFSPQKVKLSWIMVMNADEYVVFRTENNGTYETVGATTDNHFEDTSAFIEGYKYKYTVKAKNSGTSFSISNESIEVVPNPLDDLDSDGIPDNSDPDIDGDGTVNTQDAFPYDAGEYLDTDHDGIGNNADTDDDNDGISDIDEVANGLNPLDENDADADSDGDGYSNLVEIEAGTDMNINTSTPKKLTTVTTSKLGESIGKDYISLEIDDKYAYILTNDGIKIFDIENDNDIKLISSLVLDGLSLNGEKNKIVKEGQYLYVANGREGLRIIDISNKFDLKIVGVIRQEYNGSAEDLRIQGNYAYVSFNGGNALNIIDITDKESPKLLLQYTKAGLTQMNIQGDYIYADSTSFNGMAILKLDKDKKPTLIGEYVEEGGYFIGQIKVHGNYAYIFVHNTGIRVIDIKDKENPKLITTLDINTNDSSSDVSLELYAQYLFVTSSRNIGVKVIDISNPIDYKVLTYFYDSEESTDIKIKGNKLYIIGKLEGLKVFTTTPKLFSTDDSDGDGYNNDEDAFPNDKNEWLDTDGDGVGNNEDLDDDGDGISDKDEKKYELDPLNPADANEDADGDGISNIDEIKDGTNPKQNDATIKISPIDNIYVIMNTQIAPIAIEANASNGSKLIYQATSSNLDMVVPSIDDNLLTLTPINNAVGDANVTVSANLGAKSESITFEVHIKKSVISVEDAQSGVYEPIEEFSYSTQVDSTQINVNVAEDGTVEDRVIRNGEETYLHIGIAGAEVKVDREYTATITLPTQYEVHMLMRADGGVTPYVQGALLPKGALPLGTQIEADDKKVKFTIPMPASLEF